MEAGRLRLCTHCWEDKRVGDEICDRGIPTCRACKAEKHRVADHVRWWKTHAPDGYRACRRCGVLRIVGSEIRPQGITCGRCQYANKLKRERHYHRERYAAMNAEERSDYNRRKTRTRNLERHRAAAARWRDANPEKTREASRRWRQKMMADPKRAAELRENDRIYQRIWRERKGTTAHPPDPETYANGNGAAIPRGTVPAVLLAPLIREWIGKLGGRALTNDNYLDPDRGVYGAGHRELSELSGVSDRSIREIISGNRERVQFVTADRLCTALDVPLTSLYFETGR